MIHPAVPIILAVMIAAFGMIVIYLLQEIVRKIDTLIRKLDNERAADDGGM